MYGTHVYVRAAHWGCGAHVQLTNVTELDALGHRLTIRGLGPDASALPIGVKAQIGLLLPDGSRHFIRALLEDRVHFYGPDGPGWALDFYDCVTEQLPMHPDEAARRANIAAKADEERIQKLIGEGRINPDGSPRKITMAQEVALEFRPKLEALVDWEDRLALQRIDEVLAMITTRIGMAREGL